MDELNKELDAKIAQLKKTREELLKGWGDIFGLGGSQTSGQTGGVTQGNIKGSTSTETGKPSIADQIGFGKKEHDDEKEDKKIAQKEVDKHNERKHGEAKGEDSAFKTELVKFQKNGQWSLEKVREETKEHEMIDVYQPKSTTSRRPEASYKGRKYQGGDPRHAGKGVDPGKTKAGQKRMVNTGPNKPNDATPKKATSITTGISSAGAKARKLGKF